MIFVTSWDDGHPSDLRLAELLDRYGLRGTFFTPLRNREGRPVLQAAEIRALASRFEIGSHTADHVYLNEVSEQEAAEQIRAGKEGLEQMLGHGVPGFCYPGGRRSWRIEGIAKKVGVRYARTIENLRLDRCNDTERMHVHTTLQCYPHTTGVFVRNAARQGSYLHTKLGLIYKLASGGDFWSATIRLIEELAATESVFHLWGHSWEADKYDFWPHVEGMFAAAARSGARPLTVRQLFDV